MAYNYEYPYFDAGDYNSDWLINKMKELEETVIGLETFKYIGENEILDLNQQKQNSIAAFTSNFNVLNSPVSNVQRITVTYGSETAYLQQLYDLSNFTVYARNYSTASGWTAWKMTQNAPGTVMSTDKHLTTGDFNTLPDNKALFLYTNAMQNAPADGYGYLLTWKGTNDPAKIQVFFSTDNGFIYLRGFSGTTWGSWEKANNIDLTPYIKAIPTLTAGDNLNSVPKNRTSIVENTVENIPINSSFNILTLGSSDSKYSQLQVLFDRQNLEIWLRAGSTSTWLNITANRKILHLLEQNNADNIDGDSFYFGGVINTPVSGGTAVVGYGYNHKSDCYQIAHAYNNTFSIRFRNGSSQFGPWVNLAHQSNTRITAISDIPYKMITLDSKESRPLYDTNIFSELATTNNVDYISLPGQSLLHSDEGKQSFKDAILAADLSDTDVVMTNLEMWDMDIPLDTIVEEVQSLAEAVTAKNPMCELTLLSIPPVDIPRWGDELLDYTMPNGSNIRQLDDRLFRLSEDNAFTYVSFEYFYNAQNTNLLKYRGDDLKTNKQYLRRVGSFIKNTI